MNFPSKTIEDITKFLFIGSSIDKLTSYDLVLVLGNDFIQGTVAVLFDLWEKGIILSESKIILSGNVGSLNKGKTPEAERLYNCAIQEYSMPKDLFILECKATNAYENFLFSKEKIKGIGGFSNYSSILCIGKAFLLRRATMCASKMGFPQNKMTYYGTIDREGRNIGPDSWWKTEDSTKRVLEEIQRIAIYTLKGDLSLY